MKMFRKILLKLLKSTGILFVVLILVLLGSIPYARYFPKNISNYHGKVYEKIVLTGVNIIPMNRDTVLRNKNLFIDGSRIVSITSDTVFNEKYKEIQLHGKYVMPGLIDMHAHIFDKTDLPQYLSYGVTTVRNMMGFPMHLRWKQELKENRLSGSNLITASPTINSGENAGPFHKTISNAKEASEAVETYIAEGYDFIKVYDDVDSLQLKAIEKIANSKNILVSGHPPKISLKGLLSSSMSSIEHTEELLKFLDEEKSLESIRDLAKYIKASNKAVTLNLLAFDRINRISQKGEIYYKSLQKEYLNPITKFIGKKQLEIYTNAGPKYKAYAKSKYIAMENLSKIFAQEGIPILLGTDSGPNFIAAGVSVTEEMQLLKEAGLIEYDILRSATYNAANVLNKNELGRVETNAMADLLVLNQNPLLNLETLSSPEVLISNGKIYSNKDLLELRKTGENKQNTYTTLGLFLEHLFKL
jgi:hypothetical protein